MGASDVPRKKAASRDLYIRTSPRWGYREAHSRAASALPEQPQPELPPSHAL